MNKQNTKRLLITKKLRSNIAKKNVAIANSSLQKIEERIKKLEYELESEKENSKVRQRKALKQVLNRKFNAASYEIVCNIYLSAQENILHFQQRIQQEKESKKASEKQLTKAQERLKNCLQQEEKILHIERTIEQRQAIRAEIIGGDK